MKTDCPLYFMVLDKSSDNLSKVIMSELNVIPFDAKHVLPGALYGIYVDLCIIESVSVCLIHDRQGALLMTLFYTVYCHHHHQYNRLQPSFGLILAVRQI